MLYDTTVMTPELTAEILTLYSFALKYTKLAHVEDGKLVRTRPLEDVAETVSSVKKLCFSDSPLSAFFTKHEAYVSALVGGDDECDVEAERAMDEVLENINICKASGAMKDEVEMVYAMVNSALLARRIR